MKKLLSTLLALTMTACLTVPAFAAEPTTPNTNVITDRSEIEAYAQELGLTEDTDRIVKIIDVEGVTLNDPAPALTREPEIGPEEIVLKNHKMSTKRGSLIRSSDFEYPGGEMTVSETLEIGFSSSAGIDVEVISAEIGIDITAGAEVSETQYIEVPVRGQVYTCNAYSKIEHHTYDVVGDDVWFDDDLGTVTVDIPVGVTFVVIE